MKTSRDRKPESFDEVQTECADVRGAEGVAIRKERYAPFFLRFGRGVVIEEGCRFYHPDRIVLDDDVRINIGALIYGSGGVRIGRHARIGPRCFIHSANHDVVDNGFAVHERGYREIPVRIGDNVLISANVSILPGVELGDGSFVAAGAVLPGKAFQPLSRLYGVPALPHDEPQAEVAAEDAPEIALIVPGKRNHEKPAPVWASLAHHLLTSLALPQVRIFESGSILPDTIQSAIAFGPEGWLPDLPTHGRIQLWRVAPDPGLGQHVGSSQTLKLSNNERIDVPTEQVMTVVPSRRDAENSTSRISQSLFWLSERLNKGHGALSERDYQEWHLLLRLINSERTLPGALHDRIEADLRRRRPFRLRPSLFLEGVFARLTRASKALDLKHALAEPSSLVREALRVKEGQNADQKDALSRFLRRVFGHSATAHRLLAVGICAALLEDTETHLAVRGRLATEEWNNPGTAFPRSLPGKNGLCYSPLVVAWHYLDALAKDPSFHLSSDEISLGRVKISRPLHWQTIGADRLLDVDTRTISRSLIDNWLTLHTAPCPAEMQNHLSRENYRPIIADLERLWIDVFRTIQHGVGRPLLRLRPWPAPYTAAASVRYDVDRPVNAARIRELISIQGRFANAPCASWYYFVNDPNSQKDASQLSRGWQEVGMHLEQADAAIAHLGVTHHSAPTSDYWRGDRTNAALEQKGAAYGEYLATQLPTPRPSWVTDGTQDGWVGNLWVTPIYFPLEGATGNKTLDYFDRLVAEFRATISSGGHAIVGSHPDVDQTPLVELLNREDFSHVWFATVGDAVERCRRVIESGRIKSVRMVRDNRIWLQAATPLADVVVEVWYPGDRDPIAKTIQLTGRPRPIDDISAQI